MIKIDTSTTKRVFYHKFINNPLHSFILLLQLISVIRTSLSLSFISNTHRRRFSKRIMMSTDSTPSTNNDDSSDVCSRGPIIVTGGSRGIGKATCLLLSSRGYNIVINYKCNADAASAVHDEIMEERSKSKNGNSKLLLPPLVVKADVSCQDDVRRMFDTVEDHFGCPPYGLVNNAGILGKVTQDITELCHDDLAQVFATNVYGPFYCCKEFIDRASTKNKKQSGGGGGVIVNVSSGSAYIGSPLLYAMSKGALNSMMAGLTQTITADHGIRINSVAPGMTETDMVSTEMIEATKPKIPMKRGGKPSEVAETIAFFLSDASSYCCGAHIRVAGGRP